MELGIVYQLAGVGAIPYVRLIVKDLALKGWWALLASTGLSVVLNVAIAYLVGSPLIAGVALGVIFGLLANVYSDLKEPVK